MYNRGEIEIYFKHKIPYLGEKGWSRLTMLEERNIFQITAVLQFFFLVLLILTYSWLRCSKFLRKNTSLSFAFFTFLIFLHKSHQI